MSLSVSAVMRRLFRLTCFLSLLGMASCKDITHVQTGYVSDRDECRGNAENNAGVYTQPDTYPLSDKERNVALLQLFCECMKEKDWKVAGCPKPPTPPPPAVAQNQPTVVVVQSPAAQPAVAVAPAPAAGPGPGPGIKKKRKAVCPPPKNVCIVPDNSTPATPDQENQQLQGVLQRQ